MGDPRLVPGPVAIQVMYVGRANLGVTSLGLRRRSVGAIVVNRVASPGVGHGAHLFGIPGSDLGTYG